MADRTTIGASAVIDVVTNMEHSVPQSRIEALLHQNTKAIEKLADAMNNIASIETDDTATNHYDAGEYIIWQGKLYETISEINVGDTFEDGRNVQLVVLGDEIEVINQTLSDIFNILGSIENGISASTSYTIGDYIIRNNKLYKVVQNITAGGVFIEGSNILETNLNDIITNIASSLEPASSGANGLMSAADKAKLDGIAANANNYIHPSYTARAGVPTEDLQLTPVDISSSSSVMSFSVSQPVINILGHTTQLNSRAITIILNNATASNRGLMSAEDKAKLNGIASGAQANTITGIKGSNEQSYRTGNVNLSAANIGAATASDIATALSSNNSSLGNISRNCVSSGNVTFTSPFTGSAYFKNGYLTIGGSTFTVQQDIELTNGKILATITNFAPAMAHIFGFMNGFNNTTHKWVIIPIMWDIDSNNTSYICVSKDMVYSSASDFNYGDEVRYMRFTISCPGALV